MESGVLLGEAACVGAALCWAVAVQLFRRPIAEYGAQAVNLGKCTIAAALLGASAAALGQLDQLVQASTVSLLLLAASGLVGMTVGDTALFAAVDRLGVHRALLMQCLAPLFTAALAIGVYGERLGLLQAAGGVVILLGVALVILQRAATDAGGGRRSRLDLGGLANGLIAAVGQGTGVVLAKAGMAEVGFLPASFLRLGVASLGLVLALPLLGRGAAIGRVLGSSRALGRVVGPSVLGTYVAVLLMMAGIALAPASIAAVLLALPPVFSLFIDARVQRTPISGRGLLGTLIAVAGVALLTALG